MSSMAATVCLCTAAFADRGAHIFDVINHIVIGQISLKSIIFRIIICGYGGLVAQIVFAWC